MRLPIYYRSIFEAWGFKTEHDLKTELRQDTTPIILQAIIELHCPFLTSTLICGG